MSSNFFTENIDLRTLQTTVGSCDLWFHVGSALYHSSILIEECERNQFQNIVVGLPIGRDISVHRSMYPRNFAIADMLFGMALEAWFKGLRLMEEPKKSRKKQRDINRMLDTRAQILKDSGEGCGFETYLKILEEDEFGQEFADLQKMQKREDEQSPPKIGIKNHNLREMAETWRLLDSTNPDIRSVLEFYSQQIVLGRYPSHIPKQGKYKHHFYEDRGKLAELRTKVCQLIFEKHEEYLTKNGYGRSSVIAR